MYNNSVVMALCIIIIFLVVYIEPSAVQALPLNVSGFMKMFYSAQSGQVSEMNVKNVRVRASGSVDDATSFTFFVDMLRDNILLDANITRIIIPNIHITVGRFKTPFSTDNLLPGWKYPFLNRGYLKSFLSPAFRDTGVEISLCTKHVDIHTAVMNGTGANKPEENNDKSITYRFVEHLPLHVNISGNYSRSLTTSDSDITEYFDAGIDGVNSELEYAGEIAFKKHMHVISYVADIWFSYDFNTGSLVCPILTPAVKCEFFDPDMDLHDDAVKRFTIGLSAHLSKKDINRVMINFDFENSESKKTDNMVGIEYMVRY